MKIKDYKSRLGALLLAGTMAATMVPGMAFAADEGVTKKYTGSVHRADGDHFGDYDFSADFTVVDGVLTSIYFDSENWNKEINATTYSQNAIDGLLEQLRAQETLNAEGLDNVSGATRSATGIQAVIAQALADEELGIKSVAEEVQVTFNVTDENKGSGHGGGGRPTEPVTAEKTISGSVHRADGDHFGDYDFTAKFTTVDGVLTSIYFDSENWNKEINATTYSQDAIDGLLEQLRAQETLDAEKLDNVSGATRSATGIQAVIAQALADEELGIKSVAEEVQVTFNVTDENKGSGHGGGGRPTEPVTAEKTISGSVHRADGDHFGDYDFTAKFTTVDGVLTSVYFDSENWNKEINATTYSQDAIDGLLEQLRAQETLNAEGLDNVSGATRSAEGIKAVITEALADEELGIKSVAEEVQVTFNVTDENKGSGHGGGGKPTTPSVSEVFSDVEADQWYTNAIQYVYTNGIMAGMGNGKFGTQENLTRAHIAQILYNAEGKPEISAESKFSDVQNKNSWYYTAIVWANENGIMAGYGKGRFGAEDTLTREQMATVLYNYAKYKQEDVSATADLSSYTDANQISGWAQNPMKWAVATEVISGTTETTLAPLGFCTRAQAAQMMANRQK